MNFEKKFTLGLNSAVDVLEYDSFLEKYSKYIHSIYFSIPLNEKYSTRKFYSDHLKTEKEISNFNAVIKCIKEHGIKLEVCLNVNNLSEKELLCAFDYLEDSFAFDEIVCMDKYKASILEHFWEKTIIRSFNNIDPLYNNINLNGYSEIVLGKKYLFSKEGRDNLYNKGVKPRLLINNGCSLECVGCYGGNYCYRRFVDDSNYSVEYAYAMQSLWPSELWRLMNNDYRVANEYLLKLSTRQKNLNLQSILLDSYIEGNDSIIEYHTRRNSKLYFLWCGLSWFTEYYNKFIFDNIKEIKKSKNWNWYDENRE